MANRNDKYSFERAILDRTDLTSTETLVALIMLSHRNNKTGLCYPSQSTIAKQAKISRRAVIKAVHGLRLKGVVTGEAESGKVIYYDFSPVNVVHTTCARSSHKPRKNHTRSFFASMSKEERKRWALSRIAIIERETNGDDVKANREINRLRKVAGLKPGE